MRSFILAGTALFAAACAQAQPANPTDTDARVEAVLKAAPVADGHNDWPYALRLAYGLEGAKTADLEKPVTVVSTSAFATGEPTVGHTSIPWIRKGHLGYQLWSVYVPASLSPDEAVKQTFEQIGIAKSFAQRRPDVFANVLTADEAVKAVKAGKLAGIVAIEGANQVNDDIETLRKAHAQGVRSMTLAHSKNTRLFDSATDTPLHNGIAKEAPAFIAEMNRLGVLVDLSHVSPAVMNQVLDITKAPVIFSHSSARALADVPRNVPDDVLKRMPANGGIVMVTFVPQFINPARIEWQARRDAAAKAAGPDSAEAMKAWDAANPRPVTTLAMVADHVEHVAKVAGYDHVGLGGDFDGVPDLPEGLESVAKYPALFAELARRGWSDANLKKLSSENFLRVLRANEKVAKQLSKSATR
ncbi:membrane dipeptidase [Sandaracinobacter neustonicus]|uniref:Membrane dipeptidase n=1 Tax=Sandaracinobacter neustonicus TaxID=1715348 RepID=A0A501XRW0_9SPHN|nr:dipeptidase [Sandaracinobacter neustonicus]TPE63300.1 membrane dipeptidase [Sandaracinobacter neustonicus]